MKVICEKCKASYDIEDQRIPAEGMTMKCPKCLGSFQVQRTDSPAAAPAQPTPGDDTKYFIRRHTGSIFGPFAQSAILTMATDGKLDGSEDLSPDKVDWTRIADHDALGHVFGEGAAADLPAPSAAQPTGLGVPKPPPSPDAAPHQEDLPAPVSSTKMGMPSLPTPSPSQMPDLPAPKAATSGPMARPSPSGPTITPPPPDMPDLPAPRAATPGPTARPSPSGPTITPPPPDMPDLPMPRAAGSRPSTRPSPSGPTITPPPPDMPDLPAPRVTAGVGAKPEIPMPKAPAGASGPVATPRSASQDAPDLPAPKKPERGPGGLSGLPDLPAPKGAAASPATIGAKPGLAPDLPDLPAPSGPAFAGGAHHQPDLPTPRGDAPGADPGMNYGEVDLPVPAEEGEAGFDSASPLDLSELDLVAPKQSSALDGAPDLSELDLVAPKQKSQAAAGPGGDDARSDLADLHRPISATAAPGKGTPDEEPGSEVAASTGDRLLGLPKKLVIGILVGVVCVAVGGAAYVLLPRGKKEPPKDEPTHDNTNTNTPVQPRPIGKTRVAYAPAMDLDTHLGYLAAEKTYLKRYKKKRSSSLKAARAKARLCDAYRYGVNGKRLAKAKKLMDAGDVSDVERRKAKALWYLLRKQLKKARRQLKKARAKAGKDPEVHLFLGWVELSAQRNALAQKAFRQAIKYRGESAAALFGLAQTMADHRDPAKLTERHRLLAKVVKLSPRHVQARAAFLAESPATLAVAGIKALTDLSSSLGDQAAPRERAALAHGLGLVNLRAGQLDRALEHLAQASKMAPLQWQILRSEGEALLEAGDGERAVKRLKAALALSPRNDRLLEGLVRAHIARGQPLEAKDAILDFTERQAKRKTGKKETLNKPKKKARTKRGKRRPGTDKKATKVPAGPRSPYLSLARGRTALALGKATEAKNLFLESTAEAPRFTPGHVAYLRLMLSRGKLEGAKSVLELIKRKYRNTLPAALRAVEGSLLLARSRPNKAEKAFRAALESAPNNNQIQIHLALCLWQHLNKPEEAYLLLQKVYERAKSLTRVVSLLADYHWKSGDKSRAFGRFKAALKVNRSLTLRRRYAEFLLRAPDPVRLARAEKLLEPILKANSTDHAATALFALVELGKGNTKKAMTRINRALIRSSNNVSYLVIKARISEASGRTKDALAIYEDLLKAKPKKRRIMLLRARLLCRNRITKRCMTAARAIQKQWGDPEGYLLQGLGLLQLRKPSKAMRAFRKAIGKKKHYAEAHFLLGRTQYYDAVYRKALASLIRCLDLADETARWWPDVHYFLGMSYVKVRNKRMAKKHLQRYLSTKGNPDNLETSEQQRTAKATVKKL